MQLPELLIFERVVQSGSFTQAARTLGLPKSTVSRKIALLEGQLGARLLQRTTRKLSLTDAGRALYTHAQRVVAELELAELAVRQLQTAPRGLLRVTLPLSFGNLAPALDAFVAQYPEVEVHVTCTDRIVDLVEERFDVAVRIGKLQDSSLVARSIGTLRSFVVGSPRYLAQHGTPSTPADLASHEYVLFGSDPERSTVRLVRDGRESVVTVRGRFVVNDFDFVHQAVLDGLGLAVLPAPRVAADLAAGRLRRVLSDFCSPARPVHAVYPSQRHTSPAVRAFVEHLAESDSLRAPQDGLERNEKGEPGGRSVRGSQRGRTAPR